MMYGWTTAGSWLGFLAMLIWWILIALAALLFIRYLMQIGDNNRHSGAQETALDILRKRYARGEIDKKEFEEKRKDLDG